MQPTSNTANQQLDLDSIALNEHVGKQKRRGFAAMSRDRQREIASLGGRAAHQKGTAHRWTTEEARAAGRIGGHRSRARRQTAANAHYPGHGITRPSPHARSDVMARKTFLRRYSDIRYEVQLAEIDLCLGRYRFAAVALNFERMLPSGQTEPIGWTRHRGAVR